MAEKKEQSSFAKLLKIAGARRWALVASAALAVLHAAAGLAPYILVCVIMRELTRPALDMPMIQAALWQAVLIALIGFVLLFASSLLAHVAAFDILYALRRSIAAKVGRTPLGALEKQGSGALKKILADDVERIEAFIAHQIPDLVKGVVLPLATIGYLFTQEWRLALVSFLPLAVMAVWLPRLFGNPKYRALMQQYHASMEAMNAGIVEYVRAMPVMKVFGQSASTFRNYGTVVHRYAGFVSEWTKASTPAFAVFMSFVSNATLPVLALGLYLYFQDGVTLPVLLLFLLLGTGYMRPLFVLSTMGMQMNMIGQGLERMEDVLQRPEFEEADGLAIPDGHDLAFEQVDFAYVPGTPVLQGVDFRVPAGALVALVGPSGAGKSTVGQLIARYHEVNAGRITIGGVDIRQLATAQLMDHVSFVFQDSFMFQDTVLNNIRMGMDRDQEQVEAAAKAAQLHEMIMQLPQGYATRFGASGVHFSGGEQQRFQLARAMLKDAPILVMDEATAFSDPENEHAIHAAFAELIRNKTVLVIAHRLSSIVDADRILVFEDGRITAQGTHHALLADSPLYARMWDTHTRAADFTLTTHWH